MLRLTVGNELGRCTWQTLGQVVMAVVNPLMIPLLLARAAWQSLPSGLKGTLIDLVLDGGIAVLRGMRQVPFFGALWGLLSAPVLGFLHGSGPSRST